MRGRESSDWVRLRGSHLDLGFLVGLWWVCERGLVVKSGGVGGGIGVGLGLCLFMIGREVNLNEYDSESMQICNWWRISIFLSVCTCSLLQTS